MGENLKSLFLRINFHQNIPILKSEKVQIKKSYKAIFLEEVKFTEKRLCQSLVFHRCFLVNFAKFPKTLFYRTSHGPKPTNLNLNHLCNYHKTIFSEHVKKKPRLLSYKTKEHSIKRTFRSSQ